MGKKKTAKIYAYKYDDKVIYVGKTIKTNEEGVIIKPQLHLPYYNPKFKMIVKDYNKVTIEILDEAPIDKWFEPKFQKIVEKHNKGDKLLNAQHLLDGKRGYWEGTGGYWIGKKRDQNTIDRMIESKFKSLLQYDVDGNFVKEWKSIKQAAIEVFNDYELINGSAKSSLYYILGSKNIKKRFRHNSYWIKKSEFKTTKIPIKISIDKILESQKIDRKYKNRTKKQIERAIQILSKPIYQIDVNGKVIKQFKSAKIAGEQLGICSSAIGLCCRYERGSTSGYRFMFRKIKDREANYPNLETRLKYEEVRRNRRKGRKDRFSPFKNSVSAYSTIDGSKLMSFKTITIAGNQYNLKGRDIINLIDNDLDYKNIKFKFD